MYFPENGNLNELLLALLLLPCNFVPFLGYIGMVKDRCTSWIKGKGTFVTKFLKMGFAGLLKNNYKYQTCWMQMTCFLYSWWVTLFKLCEQVLVIQEREREREMHTIHNTLVFFQRIKVMILQVKIRMTKIKAHMKDLNDG